MTALKTKYNREDTHWRRWAGFYILVVLFILSWGGQFVFQLQTEIQNSEQHGQVFQMNEFWPQFFSSTFENWQSEWLQLATQALIIGAFADYLFRKGNQDHYKTQLMIEELKQEINKSK